MAPLLRTRVVALLAAAAAGLAAQVWVATTAQAATALAVSVRGNQLVDGSGAPLQLRGVNRSGPEYMCVQGRGIFDGPSDAASVKAIASWHSNAVRIPVNEDCWLGINGVPAAYSGANYRTAIQQFVNLLHQQGMYAILDLSGTSPGTQLADQQQPMADADHSPAFWASAAATFKHDPATILDLFNEPYPDNNQDTTAAWTCWRDGGTCPGVAFSAAGMQQLVNAVRGTVAKNVLLLGGPDYASALDHWLAYEPRDPAHQLVADLHVYEDTGCATPLCWDTTVAPLTASVPVVAAEYGENIGLGNCSTTVVDQFLVWADAHQVGYLAWTWDTWNICEVLILSYDGTPTPYGADVRNHYLLRWQAPAVTAPVRLAAATATPPPAPATAPATAVHALPPVTTAPTVAGRGAATLLLALIRW